MSNNIASKSIMNFFPDELFQKVKEQIMAKNMGPGGDHFYHTVAGRWLTEISFDQETEQQILDIAKQTFGNNDIRRAGFHTARYQIQNGIKPQLWKHYDQSACQYSLDMCIDTNINWQIAVDGIFYNEQPNSCVIFSGNEQMHWRPEYPTDDENGYVILLFMQFATPDHWFFVEGAKEGFSAHGHEADFKFRAKMGYWSQPDYSDGRPICKCCDYRRVLDFESQYQSEKSNWEILS